MSKDRIDVSSNSKISMPIFNLLGIIGMVGTVVLMYSSITQKITSLETSRELMNSDLLKASEQTTVDKEQYILLEELFKATSKHQELLDENIHNQVMLKHLEKQLDKALADIEKLKDKVRENGNGNSH
mgnify:FL=1|jgi:hypothetical protein